MENEEDLFLFCVLLFQSVIIAKRSSDSEADQDTLIFSIFPFIYAATSTGTEPGMDNKLGGRCLSHNMKLLFKVAQPNAPAESADPNNTGKRLHTTNPLCLNWWNQDRFSLSFVPIN